MSEEAHQAWPDWQRFIPPSYAISRYTLTPFIIASCTTLACHGTHAATGACPPTSSFSITPLLLLHHLLLFLNLNTMDGPIAPLLLNPPNTSRCCTRLSPEAPTCHWGMANTPSAPHAPHMCWPDMAHTPRSLAHTARNTNQWSNTHPPHTPSHTPSALHWGIAPPHSACIAARPQQ